jgi:predicted phage terminase large subunit-like protein
MGSGKSYMALLYPLKFIHDPHFRGIIFRKTRTELKAQSGLWENALNIYGRVFGLKNIKVWQNDLKIEFPSGATLKFSYMENEADLLAHQGAAYTFVLYDESTHFSQRQIEYIRSKRIRSANATHHKQMILTCNPDPDWFALDWIKPYLDETGVPNKAMDGVVRYFIVDADTYVWADTREELLERYPDLEPVSFTFISANCLDNVPLMEADPKYAEKLKSANWVDAQRYFFGNWYVRPSSSGFWKREWCEELHELPAASDIEKIVRAYDFAGTLKSDSNPDPDYTASCKMAKLRSGEYLILEVCRLRARYHDITKHIIENAIRDGIKVDIIIPQDPGAAGKAAAIMQVKDIVESGFYARTRPTSMNKIDRFKPFSAASQAGLVKVMKGCSNDLENKVFDDNSFYYNEMEQFNGGRKNHDDLVDATADAFMTLASKYNMPDINVGLFPDLRATKPIF